ncbi:MAG: 2-succinyl-6-hydroxy-2,4-cyclohexadiene-1-carboxylate synthase [Candidatus Hydrogenedentes bacterium]|nr:2-succinyl-6-hydroxy-2,4-cyclohexadiene-1-carboxylate synthase [Candidatus Hydrogenedentota bacterium]
MSLALKLHTEIHGTGRAPWLVFLHGFLGSGHDWDEIALKLAPRYSCLCVDLPGHGASRIEAPCSAADILGALIALLDEHHIERCTLIGYSMGGRVALSLSTSAPDRVERVALESTSLGLLSPEEREVRRASDAAWSAMLDSVDMATFIEWWYAQPLFETIRRDRARFAELVQRRVRQDPRQLALGLQSMGPGVWPSAWDAWQALSMPILLIAGEHDARYVALAREMQAMRASAQVHIIADCGHNVHWEDPPAYTAAIAMFLRNR